jgi:hypothetical protein
MNLVSMGNGIEKKLGSRNCYPLVGRHSVRFPRERLFYLFERFGYTMSLAHISVTGISTPENLALARWGTPDFWDHAMHEFFRLI